MLAIIGWIVLAAVVIGVLREYGAAIIGLALVGWLIYYNWVIALGIFVALILIGLIADYLEKRKVTQQIEEARDVIRAWKNRDVEPLTSFFIDEELVRGLAAVKSSDKNNSMDCFEASEHHDAMPYGKVSAFLRAFDISLYATEVYYASLVPSQNKDLLEICGIVITRDGIYYRNEIEKDGKLSVENKCISFAGLYSIKRSENGVFSVQYISNDSDDVKYTTISLEHSTISLVAVENFIKVYIVESKISQVLLQGKILE